MNPLHREKQLFQSDITDLILTMVETLAREQYLQHARMDARLNELEEKVMSSQLHVGLKMAHKNSTCSEDSDGESTNTTFSPDKVETPESNSSADGLAAPMCDYCFLFSHSCFPCPRCGREWYCSAACQRLRHRCHASRCGQPNLPQTCLHTRIAH
ncbi:hypothetical protein LPMP_211990 [Leishmania panamensis]|uniref:MYND-type domain-containing protein n=3 Tax=Viannia TaxID=37616 RepID=A0A088S9G5_LEIPA|nr:hypothetical protein LPMP_211990 [Leishmania panamensis]AIN98276.1 hypothetical protein LPMP_211990 [Leishmania panamensis]KAI5690606.1 hypothetical protein MNV84_03706 [Leishmania braziliensis]CAJ2473127.1 unnamed protein product [Leishmania braziliensis]